MSQDFKYEIIKKFGVISGAGTSMEIQLNLVSWNGKEARYDLRPWKLANGTMQPCKGLTLHFQELKRLKVILEGLD